MPFRNVKHSDRSTHKGEEFVTLYGLHKWIVQCGGCQARGHRPDMPTEVAQNGAGRGEMVAAHVRKYFPPLALDECGLCDVCRKFQA